MTGSEVRWGAATSVGNDPGGRKLILSGLNSFLGAATVILLISWLCTPGLWIVISSWLSAVFCTTFAEKSDEESPLVKLQYTFRTKRLVRFSTVGVVGFTLWLRLIRPQIPYSHLSGALPFTFFEALQFKNAPRRPLGDHDFPLQSLIAEEYWEAPSGHFQGWAPGAKAASMDKVTRPAWASGILPDGFWRWQETAIGYEEDAFHKEDGDGDADGGGEDDQQERSFYSPVDDPLRITNLDYNMVEPLAQALKDHDIPITHVVLVMMESARKDVFPFKAGSRLHQRIISSYHTDDADVIQEANTKLSRLTPIAEKLTGEQAGFLRVENSSDAALWDDTAEPGMGGINVQGMLTGSSLSLKSAVINYCGVGSIPVDFLSEATAEIYQPCIMQILDLFDRKKENSTADEDRGSSDFRNRQWSSVFLQSITGNYDNQNSLYNRMGFKKALYREDIEHSGASHYHENMEEINYFGQVNWRQHRVRSVY